MMRKYIFYFWKVIGFVGVMIILIIYFLFDPSLNNSFFPRCPFFLLTGYECPGCGSQRTIHALLHVEFIKAWHYNPYLILCLPVLGIIVFAHWHRQRYPRLYNNVTSQWFIYTFLIITIAWWVGRNYLR